MYGTQSECIVPPKKDRSRSGTCDLGLSYFAHQKQRLFSSVPRFYFVPFMELDPSAKGKENTAVTLSVTAPAGLAPVAPPGASRRLRQQEIFQQTPLAVHMQLASSKVDGAA